MKRFLTIAGYPAIAAFTFALLLGAASPSPGQDYNYDLPGYIPKRGTATGGPSGAPDQRQFVPGGSTGGRSGGPDQRKVKLSRKMARKAKKAQ